MRRRAGELYGAGPWSVEHQDFILIDLDEANPFCTDCVELTEIEGKQVMENEGKQ
jgi:hypothetical protein